MSPRIAIVYPDEHTARQWREAIAVELPEAQVDVWHSDYAATLDYAVGWSPPAQLFTTQPRLQVFFSTGAGVEHVLGNAHLPVSMPVVRIEDAGMGQLMVDYCRFEVLRWTQRRDQYEAQQIAGVWRQHAVSTHGEWPIGVFGFGQLGRQVARAFVADGFPVSACARSAGATEEKVRLFTEADGQFTAFLQATRVLILLAPLTPQTLDKFNRDSLQRLLPSSYVINVARGRLIVDEDLLAMLDSGHLAGAALDVFRQEPLPAQHPFWTHPRVRITPHVAAVTPIGPAAAQIAGKIRRLMRGEPISGVVERHRGY